VWFFLYHFINMYWIRETSSTMNDTMSHNIYIAYYWSHLCFYPSIMLQSFLILSYGLR
jgi:hypothetical protein